jgi:hypothetical protein
LAAAVLVWPAATARAAPTDIACVHVTRPDCTQTLTSLADALATSAHLVYLGPGPYVGNFTTAERVDIAGSEGTVISPTDTGQPTLQLSGPQVSVRNLRIDGQLALGITGARLDDLDLGRLTATQAAVIGRGLTIISDVTLTGGNLSLSSSVIGAADPFVLSQGASVNTDHSAFREDPDVPAPDRIDPPADPRAVEGSPLVDRGDPAPLAAFEPFEDVTGAPRIAGAVMRRDIGAYEIQAAAPVVPDNNVLANGDAELGLSNWLGTFAVEGYGEAFLPSKRTGTVLGAGAGFFSGAELSTPELFQRISVAAGAASIDRGQGQAAFAGLIGGYGSDADLLTVRAVFRDPEGRELGGLALKPVTAADRANETTLLYRSAAGQIPARTRAIDVQLGGERRAGTYTDAYADNLSLVLSVPGVPSQQQPGDDPVPGLKPFSGISVLTATPRFGRKGTGRFLLACASATVGPCTGSLDLRARMPGKGASQRIARRRTFTVRSGRVLYVGVHLLAKVRRALRNHASLPARLLAVSRDRQGLERRTTVPVVMSLPGLPVRRPARARGTAGTGVPRTH